MGRVPLLRVALVAAATAILGEAALRLAGEIYLRRLYAAGGPAQPGELTVLCLGESSTAGLWVDREDSYPGQLERALRQLYGSERIRLIVPPHMGQNTSQMANRIGQYLDLYRPRLVIVMAGYNNEWSLAESHIGEFLPVGDVEALEVRWLTALERLRLFKVARYFYLRVVTRERSAYMDQNRLYVFGHPELVRYPPGQAVYAFAAAHRTAFVALWQSDVGHILREAKARARVLLMTYHINPTYLPPEEFVRLAAQEGVPLVRNDLDFEVLARDGRLPLYVFEADGWHPNRRGYAVIAGNARSAITSGDLLGLGRP